MTDIAIGTTVVRRAIGAVRALAAAVVIACFAYMTIAVLVGVVGRYVFNYSIAGAEETANYAQTWMVLIGAGITMRRGMHVAVDVLAQMLPLAFQRALKTVIALASVAFLSVVIYGFGPVWEVGQFETSPALLIPMWIVYLGIPIGTIYFAIEILVALVERWDDPFGRVPTEERAT